MQPRHWLPRSDKAESDGNIRKNIRSKLRRSGIKSRYARKILPSAVCSAGLGAVLFLLPPHTLPAPRDTVRTGHLRYREWRAESGFQRKKPESPRPDRSM